MLSNCKHCEKACKDGKRKEHCTAARFEFPDGDYCPCCKARNSAKVSNREF